jgi:hypothetical protein
MSGSIKLSDDEKQEMIEDAKDLNRGKLFNAARLLSQRGELDDYIDFLSENMGLVPFTPSRRITKNFKL